MNIRKDYNLIINSRVLFVLVVIQSLSFIFFLGINQARKILLNNSDSFIIYLSVIIGFFLLACLGFAVFILPASLIYEKETIESKRVLKLSSILIIPWFNVVLQFFIDQNFNFILEIEKNAIFYLMGGSFAFAISIFGFASIKLKMIVKLLISIGYLAFCLILFLLVWDFFILVKSAELLFWHINLGIFILVLILNISKYKNNKNRFK